MPSYVVTGASRGIGYAFITHLASIPGNTVIGLVRNKAATEERLVKDQINNIHILTADINDVHALRAATAEVSKITNGAGLDVLINNAAYLSYDYATKTLENTSDPAGLEQDILRSFRTNVIGVAHTINAFLPLIRFGKEKKVITISTSLADLDLINEYDFALQGPYVISKAGTNALVANYNAALGKKEGILFLALSPGVVDTSEGVQEISERELEAMMGLMGKLVEYEPGFRGPITPEESVKLQMKVIDNATVATHGGGFVSHTATEKWV